MFNRRYTQRERFHAWPSREEKEGKISWRVNETCQGGGRLHFFTLSSFRMNWWGERIWIALFFLYPVIEHITFSYSQFVFDWLTLEGGSVEKMAYSISHHRRRRKSLTPDLTFCFTEREGMFADAVIRTHIHRYSHVRKRHFTKLSRLEKQGKRNRF